MIEAERSRGGGRDDDKGLGSHASELLSLIVAYAKQETIVPLKNLLRYVAAGVIGTVLFTAGGVLLTVTALRVTQTEAGLSKNLSWVPYLVASVVPLVGAGWAAWRMLKGDKAIGGQR